MSNDYFNHSAPLSRHTRGRAEETNEIFEAIASGFDLFPSLTNLTRGRVTYGADTGSANAITVALPKTMTAYQDGAMIVVKIAATNTGATTINVDSLGARAVKDVDGDDLAAGDLVAGDYAMFICDESNTRWIYSMPQRSFLTAVQASASAAAASASAASGSASTASGAASTATTQAGIATTKAGEASAAQVAAEAAQAAAEAAEANANAIAASGLPSRTGNAGKALLVNSGETGVEWGTPIDVQEFTSSGTWTKPNGATFVKVLCIGGGGGGGGGACYVDSVTAVAGGGGGGGGAAIERTFLASDLGATETVTVGAGGTGGAGLVAAFSTNGNNGTGGGDTTFGSHLTGFHGGGGLGGENASTKEGGQSGALLASGGDGSTANVEPIHAPSYGKAGRDYGVFSGGSAGQGRSQYSATAQDGYGSFFGGAGGGGGGGWSFTTSAQGGVGGSATAISAGGGTAGTAQPSDTTNAVAGGAGGVRQGGGGGGGARVDGNGGNGGAGGARGGGGGGGGSADNGFNSGAGGNGGDGYCLVVSW